MAESLIRPVGETSDLLHRVVACCDALSASGLLRVAVSPSSNTGFRLRDLAGSRTPCELVVYWGAWSSAGMRRGDHELIAMLAEAARLMELHLAVPTSVAIIATDTHGLLNGVDPNLISRTFGELQRSLPACFCFQLMSAIVPADTPMPDVAPIRTSAEGRRLLNQLKRQAEKLFSPEQAEALSLAYLAANLCEAPYVAARWPLGVFYHIGPPEFAPMLPSLPKLYGFAGPNRATRKPWFT